MRAVTTLHFCNYTTLIVNINIWFYFLPDPCSDKLNSGSVACRVDPKTYKAFTFAPAESCPLTGKPICASNGQTYKSECHMEKTAKQNNLKLKMVSSGHCKEEGEFRSKRGWHRLPGARAGF